MSDEGSSGATDDGEVARARCLVTGLGGFAGGHLTEALLESDHVVAGYTLPRDRHPQLQRFLDRVTLVEGDVTDADAVEGAVADFRPDVIYHLAAVTHVGRAWGQRRRTLDTNVVGTATVLQAAARLDPRPTVLLVSSGQVYGSVHEGAPPISEGRPVAPRSPYAASKACAEVLAGQSWRGEGVPTVIVRAFNYTGPWQRPDFVCSDFARQVAEAELGLRDPEVHVGDLRPVRDFTDVRDMVRGFVKAVQHGRPAAAYNLASGRGVRIRTVLQGLLDLAEVEMRVATDADRLRPAEVTSLVGDPARAREELDWSASIPLETTLRDVLDFWRRRLRESGGERVAGPESAGA